MKPIKDPFFLYLNHCSRSNVCIFHRYNHCTSIFPRPCPSSCFACYGFPFRHETEHPDGLSKKRRVRTGKPIHPEEDEVEYTLTIGMMLGLRVAVGRQANPLSAIELTLEDFYQVRRRQEIRLPRFAA